jgi:hypothetical protein
MNIHEFIEVLNELYQHENIHKALIVCATKDEGASLFDGLVAKDYPVGDDGGFSLERYIDGFDRILICWSDSHIIRGLLTNDVEHMKRLIDETSHILYKEYEHIPLTCHAYFPNLKMNAILKK